VSVTKGTTFQKNRKSQANTEIVFLVRSRLPVFFTNQKTKVYGKVKILRQSSSKFRVELKQAGQTFARHSFF